MKRKSKLSVSAERRHAMIAEAAYFLAQRRGFTPGYELEDWLEAEKQVARQLEELPPAEDGSAPRPSLTAPEGAVSRTARVRRRNRPGD